MAALFALTNCAHSKDANARRSNASLHGEDSSASTLLADRMAALSPQVRAKEAQRLADCAYLTSRQLARDYRVIGPPLFHNFLVNIGVRERGLCFQWARDLFVKLDQLPLQTLELHWGRRAPERGVNTIALSLPPKASHLKKVLCSMPGAIPDICSGRPFGLIIIRGKRMKQNAFA